MADVPSGCPLTARQLEVMRLTALGGLQAPAIARRLGISASAVQSHRNHIYRRLGVNNAVGASMACLRNGWFRDKRAPETATQEYLRHWEKWLRTEDGSDFCIDLLGRIGLKLVGRELRRTR